MNAKRRRRGVNHEVHEEARREEKNMLSQRRENAKEKNINREWTRINAKNCSIAILAVKEHKLEACDT